MQRKVKILLLSGIFAAVFGTMLAMSNIASATTPKCDGTKACVTIWFDHAYSSQLAAMQNMSDDGIKGGILIVYNKANANGYATWQDLHTKQAQGWELISHSMDHKTPLPSSPQSFYDFEIIASKNGLQTIQNITVIGYASPADLNTNQSIATQAANYQWAALGVCKLNNPKTIANDAKTRYGTAMTVLHHCGVDDNFTSPVHGFDGAKSLIDTAEKNHSWLVLNFHQIDYINDAYHTKPQTFKKILDYIQAKVLNGTITTVTPCEGLSLC